MISIVLIRMSILIQAEGAKKQSEVAKRQPGAICQWLGTAKRRKMVEIFNLQLYIVYRFRFWSFTDLFGVQENGETSLRNQGTELLITLRQKTNCFAFDNL